MDEKFETIAKTIKELHEVPYGICAKCPFDEIDCSEIDCTSIHFERLADSIKDKYKACKDFIKAVDNFKAPIPLLNEVEKEYLTNLIKPFTRKHNVKILKWTNDRGTSQCLIISLFDKTTGFYEEEFYLPNFKTGTMYKGMKSDRKYTAEELGLR